MSYIQTREAVTWLPKQKWPMWEMLMYDWLPEFRFAHRRCWKKLSERRRQGIRTHAERGCEPSSLGARL